MQGERIRLVGEEDEGSEGRREEKCSLETVVIFYFFQIYIISKLTALIFSLHVTLSF
jgi:hypothetical protein